MKKITVLLADNHTVVRQGFRRGLEGANGELSAESVHQRFDPAPARPLLPEMVVMDMWMPVLLKHLAHEVLHAQEEERRRISRKLHDEVEQALALLHAHLEGLKQTTRVIGKSFKRRVRDAQGLLEQTMETVHRFARELRPAMLDDLGLIPTLRSYVQAYTEATGVRVCFSACVAVEKLGSEQKTVLYRVAQAGLTHAARQAQATQVDLSIRNLRNGIRMEMIDNGPAFRWEPASAGKGKEGLGLLGIQERVRLIGGDLAVESGADQGTTIRVTIPFKLNTFIPHEKNHCSLG